MQHAGRIEQRQALHCALSTLVGWVGGCVSGYEPRPCYLATGQTAKCDLIAEVAAVGQELPAVLAAT